MASLSCREFSNWYAFWNERSKSMDVKICERILRGSSLPFYVLQSLILWRTRHGRETQGGWATHLTLMALLKILQWKKVWFAVVWGQVGMGWGELCAAGIWSSSSAQPAGLCQGPLARADWAVSCTMAVPWHSPVLSVMLPVSRMPTASGCWPVLPPGLWLGWFRRRQVVPCQGLF